MDHSVINAIEENRIIVIIRRIYGDAMLKLVDALVAGGIRLVEVTFDQSDPDCLANTGGAIGLLEKKFPGTVMAGAGTVVNTAQVDAAAASGARYIISPNTNVGVIRHTKGKGLVSMPGAMTPSEILTAHDAGADFVKIFPVADLGLGYIRNIRAPISHVKLIATAGINEENFADHLKAGFTGAGISGRLTDKKAMEAGDWGELTRRAAVFAKIAADFGGAGK